MAFEAMRMEIRILSGALVIAAWKDTPITFRRWVMGLQLPNSCKKVGIKPDLSQHCLVVQLEERHSVKVDVVRSSRTETARKEK